MTFDRDGYLAALHRDGLAFGEICTGADPQLPVPSCPGWNVGDLIYHLTEVHDFWARIVHEHVTDPSTMEPLPRAAEAELLDAYWAGFDRLRMVLGAAPDDQPSWTWSDDHTVGFVVRRMTHETAVHLWDAADACARPAPIEADLASDGIDEFLTQFQSGTEDGDPSAHVHCTDVPGEWTVRAASGEYAVTREHAKGDIAMRGAASDLLLALWNRVPLSAIDLIGDQATAERFLSRFSRN